MLYCFYLSLYFIHFYYLDLISQLESYHKTIAKGNNTSNLTTISSASAVLPSRSKGVIMRSMVPLLSCHDSEFLARCVDK